MRTRPRNLGALHVVRTQDDAWMCALVESTGCLETSRPEKSFMLTGWGVRSNAEGSRGLVPQEGLRAGP